MSSLKSFLSGIGKRLKSADPEILTPQEDSGGLPASQDTLAAINELSEVAKNNPEAVEIFLALGNLYRSQGEIERAVQIRNSLIVRPGLADGFKAKAWYELGRDYKRGGFIDRALASFEKAYELRPDNANIVSELARLSSDAGEFERAADYYSRLKHPIAQAHYLVRLAQKSFAGGEDSQGAKWLNKAFKVRPGSIEAWLTKISLAISKNEFKKIDRLLRDAFEETPARLRFLLLEGLLNPPDLLTGPGPSDKTWGRNPWSLSSQDQEGEDDKALEKCKDLCRIIIPIIEQQPQDLLLEYYGARFLIKCGEHEQAKAWLEKTLLLQSDFWPARLELLALTMDDQHLSPVFKVQLEFFISQTHQFVSFICQKCGLKRKRIFFVCPQCQGWHTISFRTDLFD